MAAKAILTARGGMTLDPISFEVIRNALVAATDEMVLTLRRSAYSTNIKTRSDFSCAFFDAELRAVAQGFTQPVHLGSMVEQVPKAVLEYGPEKLAPGDMRGDASWTLDVDFGPDSVWGVDRYFTEQLRFFEAYLREDGEPLDDPPVRIFVMGGGSGRRTELGKLDHGGRWRDEREWPLARTQYTNYYLSSGGRANSMLGDGTLSTTPPSTQGQQNKIRPTGAESDSYVYDPDNPVPTLGGNLCCAQQVPSGPWDQDRKSVV